MSNFLCGALLLLIAIYGIAVWKKDQECELRHQVAVRAALHILPVCVPEGYVR